MLPCWITITTDGSISLSANDTEPNFLYRNNGDGTFTDESPRYGNRLQRDREKPVAAWGLMQPDIYNNGGTAIAIGNFSNEKTAFFYAKPGDTYFTDSADRGPDWQGQLPFVDLRRLIFRLRP